MYFSVTWFFNIKKFTIPNSSRIFLQQCSCFFQDEKFLDAEFPLSFAHPNINSIWKYLSFRWMKGLLCIQELQLQKTDVVSRAQNSRRACGDLQSAYDSARHTQNESKKNSCTFASNSINSIRLNLVSAYVYWLLYRKLIECHNNFN